MNQGWGREKEAGNWPSRYPVGILWAITAAVLAVVAIFTYQYKQVWPPVQRIYLPTYLHTLLSPRKDGVYTLLTDVDRKGGRRLALEDEVIAAPMAKGEPGWALTEQGRANGAVGWSGSGHATTLGNCSGWLPDLPRPANLGAGEPAWWGGLATLIAGIVLAIPGERKRATIWKDGRRLKGPELVTTAEFNRRNRSDGMGF